RSASGRRTQVVLDFIDCRHHEGVAVSNCSGVTIADLTVENVRQNGIKINSNLDVDRVTIHNVISHNVWQRHVKGPAVPDKDGQADFVDDCRIQYCLFYNDRPKQPGDEPWEDSNPGMGFNYIGGIDAMCARGWTISDNVFTGIRGKTGEARGAIFLWHNGTDCLIERNILIDCDTGICLGNSSARGERRHANGCIVRNNFIARCSENNILADHTRDCKILNNTVHDPESRFGRLLRVVHANDGLVATNNIFSGPQIVVEQTEGLIRVQGNLIRPVGDYFVDAAAGNLHLRATAVDAIDRATADNDVRDDIDGRPRNGKPDLGADEWTP
ncbi:MAG TPA: right-handed parallel beta-helix repeat-containing protein, partial [Thermoguttaceae bacterium]|nr:right-handed parallel beta-helix repeat-containing protein [Thermoguttaceae bacterium]